MIILSMAIVSIFIGSEYGHSEHTWWYPSEKSSSAGPMREQNGSSISTMPLVSGATAESVR